MHVQALVTKVKLLLTGLHEQPLLCTEKSKKKSTLTISALQKLPTQGK